MICLKHNQLYNQGEYCVYCGNPYLTYVSTHSTATIKGIISLTKAIQKPHEVPFFYNAMRKGICKHKHQVTKTGYDGDDKYQWVECQECGQPFNIFKIN